MAGFSLYYFQFLKALPKPYIKGFFCSCLIFLSGSIGLETISAKIFISLEQSPKDLMYNLVTTMEESCEMIGIIMFINVLLSYLKSMNVATNLYFRYSE
jgi:enamine deaminase RidA (YjgF/YER057c/UK114 family)